MSKGFGFTVMKEAMDARKALMKQIHVVDNRTIRVTLTFREGRAPEFKRQNCGGWTPRQQAERAVLSDEVQRLEVKEGRCYVGPLPDNCSPNLLEDHFKKFGLVARSDVSRKVSNPMKKNFGTIRFRETQACKRVLQNPRHLVNGQQVEVALSKFCLEMLMSASTVWLWEVSWSLEQAELARHFASFGAVFRALHIFNPSTGEKKGYGLVDFVKEDTVAAACSGAGKGPWRFTIKGQQGFYGRFLPKELKRDLMYMEDRCGHQFF